jgi:hypothetical protein
MSTSICPAKQGGHPCIPCSERCHDATREATHTFISAKDMSGAGPQPGALCVCHSADCDGTLMYLCCFCLSNWGDPDQLEDLDHVPGTTCSCGQPDSEDGDASDF